MKSEVTFHACVYKITTDREGESRIIFEVSRRFLAQAITLNAFIEKELEVKVTQVKKKGL